MNRIETPPFISSFARKTLPARLSLSGLGFQRVLAWSTLPRSTISFLDGGRICRWYHENVLRSKGCNIKNSGTLFLLISGVKKTQGVCLICVVGFWPMGLQLQWGPRPNLVCSLFWLLNRNRLPCTLDVGLGWSALVSCPLCAFVRVVGFSGSITFQRWPSQSILGEIHSTKHPSASTKACHRDWLQPQHHIARLLPVCSGVDLFSGCNSEPFPAYIYSIYHW